MTARRGETGDRSFHNVWVTGLTSLLTDISSEMVYPLVPVFLTAYLGAGPAALGFIEGVAESLASILKAFSGYISDRVGRRKPLAIVGYAFSPVGKLALFLAGSWVGVFAGRVLDRFGKGIRTAPRDALISESVSPSERGHAFGVHRALDTLGAAAGVALAMAILAATPHDRGASMRFIFLLSVIPAALGVGVLFLAREVRPRAVAVEPPRLRWADLDPTLKRFLLVTFLFSLGNSSNQFILLRASRLGASLLSVLGLYLAYNVSYALLSWPAGRLSDRFGRRRVIVPGYLFYAVVYFLLARATSVSHLLGLFVAYGFYMGLTEGVEKAVVSDLSTPHERASALGLHATLVGLGLFPASALAGLLWRAFGPQATFYFGSAVGLAAAAGMAVVLMEVDDLNGRSRRNA